MKACPGCGAHVMDEQEVCPRCGARVPPAPGLDSRPVPDADEGGSPRLGPLASSHGEASIGFVPEPVADAGDAAGDEPSPLTRTAYVGAIVLLVLVGVVVGALVLYGAFARYGAPDGARVAAGQTVNVTVGAGASTAATGARYVDRELAIVERGTYRIELAPSDVSVTPLLQLWQGGRVLSSAVGRGPQPYARITGDLSPGVYVVRVLRSPGGPDVRFPERDVSFRLSVSPPLEAVAVDPGGASRR